MKPIFHIVAKDSNRDSDAWNTMVLIHFVGELATAPDCKTQVSDDQIREIYEFCEAFGIHFQSAGSGDAGCRFANEPLIQWYPNHILITQSGGRDV